MLSKQSKILVTGATGFLGSYIVRRLISEGYSNVTCLKRVSSSSTLVKDIESQVSWAVADILDMPLINEIVQGQEYIIHTAAVVDHFQNRKKVLQASVEGTANLVNAALTYEIQKFVHLSSVAAIGRRKPIENISEKQIFTHSKFDTTYALAKFLGEQEVWRGHAEGLNVTILNPSMILGAGIWDKSSVQIFNRIYRGMPFYPKGSTGWVDVRDVAYAVVQCMEANHDGERYIISAENLTYQSVFSKISDFLHVARPAYRVNSKYARFYLFLAFLKTLFNGNASYYNKETILSTSTESIYDNSKFLKQFPFSYTPIEKTIEECCNLFLESKISQTSYGVLPPQTY